MQQEEKQEKIFEGFTVPTKNFFHMPNNWTDVTAEIDNLAELKIVEYVMRHTWGYKEYGIAKTISVDEFLNGRRRQDGSRIDKGTGLKSDRSVKDGLKLAIKHGYLICEIDASDLGRTRKSYTLQMTKTGVDTTPQVDTTPGVDNDSQVGSIYPSGVQHLPLRDANTTPRTEKETRERKPETRIIEPALSLPDAKANIPEQPSLLNTSLAEPSMSGNWNDEKVVQYTEFRNGRRYAPKMREAQLAAAKWLFSSDKSLTLDTYKQAFDERLDAWWLEHKKVLHVTDMKAKETNSGVIRLYAMLDRIEANKNKPNLRVVSSQQKPEEKLPPKNPTREELRKMVY